MRTSVHLCAFCSKINFNDLRHPTVGEIQGSEIENSDERRSFDEGSWVLGLQSRITASSASCRLCYAICELVRQQPRIKRRWNFYSWNDPACVCYIQGSGYVEPKSGAFWQSYNQRGISQLSLYWTKSSSEELIRPGPLRRGVKHGKKVHLLDAFQACQRGVPQVSVNELFGDQNSSPEEVFCGGRLRPEVVDARLLKRWLHECIDNHGRDCGPLVPAELEDRLPKFRLIDVKSQMVAELLDVDLSKLQYVALSYVWGKGQPLMLTKETYHELQQRNSTRNAPLPQTIRDAITITNDLDIPYIWIDSLCIIQDDEDDVDTQIGKMGTIYSQATVTVVSAFGDTAESGLPGISWARNANQIEVPLPNQNCGLSKSILSTLSGRPGHAIYTPSYQDTTWASRGWTHQEHILSNRLLVFMEHQVLWECGTCSWSEESHCEVNNARLQRNCDWYNPRASRRSDPRQTIKDAHGLYAVVMQLLHYRQRKLTHEGDFLDAIDGILSYAEKLSGQGFTWGMPHATFHSSIALLQSPSIVPTRRTCLTRRRVTSLKRRTPFPSWSWTGWRHMFLDHMLLDLELQDAEDEDTKTRANLHTNAYFILKNRPLRLDPIGLHERPGLPFSLESVITSCSQLSAAQAEEIPDNQLICFVAEVVRFSDARALQLHDVKDVPPGTKFFTAGGSPFMISQAIPYPRKNDSSDDDSDADLDEYEAFTSAKAEVDPWYRVIVHTETHRLVGQSAPCGISGPDDVLRDPALIYLYCDSEDVVALEVFREQGIFYRANVAKISKTLWLQAAFKSEIIVLG